jgi:UDP-N-acetylglucosamine--N-acetylmuramyl-(pentapeptide) pyrophosphoryl-undecaprenol N-acetylglucosamine transferase
MKNNKKTIVVTGGHLSPAVAFSEYWKHTYPDSSIVFIGRKTFFSGSGEQVTEKKAMQPYADILYFIDAVRLGSKTVLLPFIFLRSLFCVLLLLIHNRPSCIVSFGGYVAVPVCIAGFILRIPVVTHEQTHLLGAANRFISLFATDLCLTFPNTEKVKRNQWYVTGLPVRQELFESNKTDIHVDTKKPLLYITGGTTGAQSLNNLVFPIIPSLLNSFSIIHQTGPVSFKKAIDIQTTLSPEEKSHYVCSEYFYTSEISWIYHHAKIVLCRSGANTVYELALLGIPAILVPLPWATGDEQQKNAQWLVDQGGSILAKQDLLTPISLEQQLFSVLREYEEYKSKAEKFAVTVSRNGAGELAKIVSKYVY